MYSSNVLEHVEQLDSILLESRRVLIPGGLAVHILPSPSWRAWTSCAHYLAIMRSVTTRRKMSVEGGDERSAPQPLHAPSLGRLIRQNLFPSPHGVYPNALSELYYFSKSRWRRLLQRSGFEPIDIRTNGLFYTGYGLCPALSITSRRRLALVLGSACNIFVLKKTTDPGEIGSLCKGSAMDIGSREANRPNSLSCQV